MEIIDSAVASCILNPTVSQKPTFPLGANVFAAFDAGGAWAGWEDREGDRDKERKYTSSSQKENNQCSLSPRSI